MTQGLVEVDINLIRRLRLEGRGWEATLMLKAYHENLNKQREEDRIELKRIKARVWAFRHREDMIEWRKNHPEKSREYYLNHIKKLKEMKKNG